MCKKPFYLCSIVFLGLVSYTPGLTETNPVMADKSKSITLDTDPNLVGWWKFDEVSVQTRRILPGIAVKVRSKVACLLTRIRCQVG